MLVVPRCICDGRNLILVGFKPLPQLTVFYATLTTIKHQLQHKKAMQNQPYSVQGIVPIKKKRLVLWNGKILSGRFHNCLAPNTTFNGNSPTVNCTGAEDFY